MKRLKKFANSTKEMVLSFLNEIVMPAMKILAKGISIVLKPILSFILAAVWGSGLGFLLVGLGIGIGLIAFAIKKVTDYLVDDIGPIIKGWLEKLKPETIERGVNMIIGLGESLTSMLNAIIAPIKVVLDGLAEALKPVMEFINTVLKSFIDNVTPIITTIFDIIGGFILTILKAIEPAIMRIADIIGGTIVTILDTIGPIIEAM